jgi:hypothetical protein
VNTFIDKWANWTADRPSGKMVKSNPIGLPAPASAGDPAKTLPAEVAPNLAAVVASPKGPAPSMPSSASSNVYNNTAGNQNIKASQDNSNELLLSMMLEGNAVKNILNMRPR